MNTQAVLNGIENEPAATPSLPTPRIGKKAPLPIHFMNHAIEDDSGQRQADKAEDQFEKSVPPPVHQQSSVIWQN